jgi:thiol:disulfide interchange protein DsbD
MISRLTMLLLLLASHSLVAQEQPLLSASPATGDLTPANRPALLTGNPVNQVLPADSAFAMQVRLLDDATRVALHWDIAPGYYLYRKSLKLGSAMQASLPLELPRGEAIEDEYFGAVEVYYDQLDLTATTADATASDGTLLLVIEYQGCATDRYCYPPQRKELLLALP